MFVFLILDGIIRFIYVVSIPIFPPGKALTGCSIWAFYTAGIAAAVMSATFLMLDQIIAQTFQL